MTSWSNIVNYYRWAPVIESRGIPRPVIGASALTAALAVQLSVTRGSFSLIAFHKIVQDLAH